METFECRLAEVSQFIWSNNRRNVIWKVVWAQPAVGWSTVNHRKLQVDKKKRWIVECAQLKNILASNARAFNPDTESGFGCCGWILIICSYFLVVLCFPIAVCFCFNVGRKSCALNDVHLFRIAKVVQEYQRAVIFRLGRILPGMIGLQSSLQIRGRCIYTRIDPKNIFWIVKEE